MQATSRNAWRRDLIVGLAAAAWAGLWLLALHWAVFLWPSSALPAEFAESIAIPWDAFRTRVLGVPEPFTFPLVAMLVMLAIAAVPAIFRALVVLLRMDQEDAASECLRWASGGLARFGLVCLGAALLSFPVVPFNDVPLVVLGPMLLVPAVALLGPFFLWRPEVVSGDAPRRWWKPGWPGAVPFVLACVYLLVVAFVSSASTYFAVATGGPVVMGVWLLEDLLLTTLLLPVAYAWLWRSTRAGLGVDLRRSLAPRLLLPWLVLEARVYGLVLLVLGPPVLATMIYAIFFLPQHELLLEQAGASNPLWMDVVAIVSRLPHGHAVILVPFLVVMDLARARLLYRSGGGASP